MQGDKASFLGAGALVVPIGASDEEITYSKTLALQVVGCSRPCLYAALAALAVSLCLFLRNGSRAHVGVLPDLALWV